MSSSADGKLWQPTKRSLICSHYFEGGKKSEDPRTNAYNPTIFLPIYKRKQPSTSGRAKRLAKRHDRIYNSVTPVEELRTGKVVFSFLFMCTDVLFSGIQ